MTDNYLRNVILFNYLDKEDRISFLYEKLKKNGFSPKIQNYLSSFGKGRNLFATVNSDKKKRKIILSAHYDGESLFDNAGGVIALLDLTKKIQKFKPPVSVVILFTDQEEKYQQGAAHFIKENINENILYKNINVDGFGIGNAVFSVSDLTKNKNSNNDLFLCDSDEFIKNGIPSISCFSAFIEDYNRAKLNNDILSFFKKYITKAFYEENFNTKRYNLNGEKLWNMMQMYLSTQF